MSRIPLIYHTNIKFYTQYTHPTLIFKGEDAHTHTRTDARKIFTQYWLQLQCDPIKIGWFIKLYSINVKVLYKQADMGFAAEAGFWGVGRKGVLITSGTAIPPDKLLSQAPARDSMAFPLPPSMKVEFSLSFLLPAHVSKIFKFQIFCSTYIHRNSIVQKNVRRRNWYSLHTYIRTKYKPKILHT